MNVPASARLVKPLVRWSANHRLTALSCAIALFRGWVISQPTPTSTPVDTARVTTSSTTVLPSERSVGGENRLGADMRRIVPYAVPAALHRKG